ncbi:MAG: glycosyltransferase family 9 protein [Bacteroidales bacterium]|nr:glycosyltransferase family 9 protein [Bacteroidales bacterium]
MKILIVRLSSIGDIVLTTPIVRCIHKAAADIEIHYLCKPAFLPILETNPYISKIHIFNKYIHQTLLSENFDYIIDLQNNHRSNKLCRRLKKPVKHLNKLNLKKWLFVHFKINHLPNIHIVDRYMECTDILPFKVDNDQQGIDFFLTDADRASTETLPYNKLMAVAVGSQHFTKEIPADKIIAIGRQIALPLVLLGGKDDIEKAQQIQQALQQNVINLCGKLSIRESAAVIEKATVLLTGDTGLMHIASAFSTPIISLWGNTTPQFGMYPYTKNTQQSHLFQVEDLPCRPCSKLGFDKCPKKHFNCMNLIDNQKIIKLINELSN